MIDDSEVVFDDDQDVYNDETFGAHTGEWDGPAGEFNFDGQTNFENVKSNDAGSSKPPANDYLYHDDESAYFNVEESISRLVMEDDLDDAENMVKTSHKLLLPPQVINKNLEWLSKDVSSPLFSSSVWAIGPSDQLRTKRNEMETGNVFSSKPFTSGVPGSRPPPGLTQHRGPITLDEIEREIFDSQNNIISSQHADDSTVQLSSNRNNARIQDTHEWALSAAQNLVEQQYEERLIGPDIPRSTHSPYAGVQSVQPKYEARGNERLHPRHQQAQRTPVRLHHQQNQRGYQNHSGSLIVGNRTPHQVQSQGSGNQFTPRSFAQRSHYQRSSERNNISRSKEFQSDQEFRTREFSLMSIKDKQRLKNIKIIQLQNDHPYTTDYYNLMKTYNATENIECLKKLFPLPSQQHKNVYEPMHFENSLGKLQSVSALAPRRLLDTFLQVHSTTALSGNEVIPVLGHIERVYKLFLDLKELKCRKIAGTLNDNCDSEFELQLYLKIVKELDESIDISKWIYVRKGRMLFFHMIEEFNSYGGSQNAAFMILANFMNYLTFEAMNEMVEDPGYNGNISCLSEIILDADISQTDMLLQAIKYRMWESSFGCTILLLILEKACTYVLDDIVTLDWANVDKFNESNPITLNNPSSGHALTGFLRLPGALLALAKQSPNDFGVPSRGVDLNGIRITNVIQKAEECELRGRDGSYTYGITRIFEHLEKVSRTATTLKI